MIDEVQITEQFTISDLETLKIIADPFRLTIMRAMREARTVKEVAAEIDTPPTKLYYHVNQLEKHGLIRVVDTNIVSGIIEKHYQVVAHNYRIDEELLSDKEFFSADTLETLIIAILDDTRNEVMRSIRAGLIDKHDPERDTGNYTHGALNLSKEQAADFNARLESLTKEFDELSRNNQGEENVKPYGFAFIFYPAAPSGRGEEKSYE